MLVFYSVIKFGVNSFTGTSPNCSVPDFADLKRQFHFSSDCTPKKEIDSEGKKDISTSEQSNHKLQTPSPHPHDANPVSVSPRHSDISSDFDVSMSSDVGHESGIHPLLIFHSRENSLDDIKEEISGELKSSDSSSISTSSPKKSSMENHDLNFIPEPHSPVQVSEEIRLPSVIETNDTSLDAQCEDSLNQRTNSKVKDVIFQTLNEDDTPNKNVKCESTGNEDIQDTVTSKLARTASSEYSDVFEDIQPDLLDNSDVFVTGKKDAPPPDCETHSIRDQHKLHPRLRALSQLTDHMSPVGNPANILVAGHNTIFSADIATSSPIPQNVESKNEQELSHIPKVPTFLSSFEDSHNKEISRVEALEPKSSDLTTLAQRTSDRTISDVHNPGRFKIPANARGTKRPLSSSTFSPSGEKSTVPSHTGLTLEMRLINVAGNTPKRQDIKKSPEMITRRDSPITEHEKRSSVIPDESRYWILLS